MRSIWAGVGVYESLIRLANSGNLHVSIMFNDIGCMRDVIVVSQLADLRRQYIDVTTLLTILSVVHTS